VKHTGSGSYQLTVTASQCANADSAPVVTIVGNNAPSGTNLAGEFPTAYAGTGGNTFSVFTGYVLNGQFRPFDETFAVQVECA
jgi:hypothetical protein